MEVSNVEPSHIAFRRGIILLSGFMLRTKPEELLPIFSRLVVLEVREDRFNDRFRYLAVSPDFELWNPVEAMEPPEYAIIISTKDDVVSAVTFKKL